MSTSTVILFVFIGLCFFAFLAMIIYGAACGASMGPENEKE